MGVCSLLLVNNIKQHLFGFLPLEEKKDRLPETSVMTYQFSLLINTEQHSSPYQMETQLSWNITACQIINIYRRFERYYQ